MISSASCAPKRSEGMNCLKKSTVAQGVYQPLLSPKHAMSTSNFLVLSMWHAPLQGAGLCACLHEAQCKLYSILLLFEDIERTFQF